MGQIAACLTDLICLIEQRDAFGFTSPSKAADSASVKKRGRKKKKEKKNPLQPFHCNRHTFTPAQLLEDLFMSFKHLIHCSTTQPFSDHRPLTKTESLENLSTVSVID